ncbi:MAG: exodeoxyribonuclease VII small subunit [Bacillota bacterium]
MKFEEGTKKLDEIISKLESEETSFEESIALFENGVKITKQCLDVLQESKGKITKIKEELDGLVETPF